MTNLNEASDRLAEELRGFPPLAQRSAKKLINDIEDAGLSLVIELEGQCYGRLAAPTISAKRSAEHASR